MELQSVNVNNDIPYGIYDIIHSKMLRCVYHEAYKLQLHG